MRNAGEITEGTEVEIVSPAGRNDERSDEDVGGRSANVAPVYDVTDVFRIPPTMARGFASGPDGLELIAIGYGDGGDGETVEGFWETTDD